MVADSPTNTFKLATPLAALRMAAILHSPLARPPPRPYHARQLWPPQYHQRLHRAKWSLSLLRLVLPRQPVFSAPPLHQRRSLLQVARPRLAQYAIPALGGYLTTTMMMTMTMGGSVSSSAKMGLLLTRYACPSSPARDLRLTSSVHRPNVLRCKAHGGTSAGRLSLSLVTNLHATDPKSCILCHCVCGAPFEP
jgi:hypothetical protein